jgi:hypothetical protein
MRRLLAGKSKTARFVWTFAGMCLLYAFIELVFFHDSLTRQIPGMLGGGIGVGLFVAFMPEAWTKNG